MTDFLQVLEQHWRGVFILVFLITVLALIVRWLFWLLGWGRFAPRSDNPAQIGVWSYFGTTFVAKTVKEFRHLLALLIFLLFSAAVILSMLPGLAGLDVGRMTDGLQGVAASLGGLIGSIIGYYFGEQAGASANRPGDDIGSSGEAIQDLTSTGDGIQPARIPQSPSSPESDQPGDETPSAAP